MSGAAAVDADAFNAFEAEGWERRAAGYHDFFAPIATRAAEPLLDAAGAAAGSRVLDVASGPGYVSAAAARRGCEVTGVDIAAEMVDLARRLHPGPRFRRADAERLPFEAASFDAAVAGFAILHLGRPERAARELARVVVPGGGVAVSVWDVPRRSRLMGVFVDAVAAAGAPAATGVPSGPDFFRFADDRELAALLVDAGFVEPRIEALEFRQRLGSAGELWDGMLAGTVRMRAMIDGRPPEARRRIRTEFDRLVVAYETSQGIEVPVRVKIGAARRPDRGSNPDR